MWSEQQRLGAAGSGGEEGGHAQSGVGCIQFQAAKQMALEIKDYTADFEVELILIRRAPGELEVVLSPCKLLNAAALMGPSTISAPDLSLQPLTLKMAFCFSRCHWLFPG